MAGLRRSVPVSGCVGAFALTATLLWLAGCSGRSSYPTIPPGVAGRMQTLDMGTVVAVKDVTIDGSRSNVGPLVGATVGSATGQLAGQGRGRILTTAAGAAAGAVAGGVVEKELTKKRAQEISISMDDGGTVVVVQPLIEPPFIEGDRVRITSTPAGESIVAHADFETDGLY